ncbi:MAG: phage holin family protein [bacterium]
MLNAVIKWVFLALGLLLIDAILPGLKISGFFAALMATLMIGILNIVLKPILSFITLPINILTFGLFTLVINALLFMLAAAIIPGFAVSSFVTAVLASILYSFISIVINYSASELRSPRYT